MTANAVNLRDDDGIRTAQKRQIWSHLLKKSLMENLIFCAVTGTLRSTLIRAKANGGDIKIVDQHKMITQTQAIAQAKISVQVNLE